MRHKRWFARLPTYLSVVVLTTVAALAGLAGPSAAAASRAVAASALASSPTIQYGARGSTVTYLQQRLVTLRYDVGGVDGVFGGGLGGGLLPARLVSGDQVDR